VLKLAYDGDKMDVDMYTRKRDLVLYDMLQSMDINYSSVKTWSEFLLTRDEWTKSGAAQKCSVIVDGQKI